MKFIFCKSKFLLVLLTLVVSAGCANNTNNSQSKTIKNGENYSLLDLYRTEIAYKVSDNWIISKKMECNDKEQTSIVFSILPDGNINDMIFFEKSKCTDLNDSAFSAIERAAPFKPFPRGLKMDVVEIGLRFHPDGVR